MTRVIDAPDAKAPPTAKHQVTDLLEVLPGLLAKFECNNAGGSHKVRAARYIVDSAIATGAIVPGQTTVIDRLAETLGSDWH